MVYIHTSTHIHTHTHMHTHTCTHTRTHTTHTHSHSHTQRHPHTHTETHTHTQIHTLTHTQTYFCMVSTRQKSFAAEGWRRYTKPSHRHHWQQSPIIAPAMVQKGVWRRAVQPINGQPQQCDKSNYKKSHLSQICLVLQWAILIQLFFSSHLHTRTQRREHNFFRWFFWDLRNL